MKYPFFIWADGLPAPEELTAIQRELPAWIEQMDSQGLRLGGRELDLPETAATVRVRRGETLVTDGPFAETKEFLAGFDVLEFDELDDAIEAATRNAISWFQAIEIRSFLGGPRLGERALPFLRGDDSAATPYLLSTWTGERTAPFNDERVMQEYEVWRQTLEARGIYVLGNQLDDPV